MEVLDNKHYKPRVQVQNNNTTCNSDPQADTLNIQNIYVTDFGLRTKNVQSSLNLYPAAPGLLRVGTCHLAF